MEGITSEYVQQKFAEFKKRAPGLQMITLLSSEGFPIASTFDPEKAALFSAFIAAIHNTSGQAIREAVDDMTASLESGFLQGTSGHLIFIGNTEANLVVALSAKKSESLGMLEIIAKKILNDAISKSKHP